MAKSEIDPEVEEAIEKIIEGLGAFLRLTLRRANEARALREDQKTREPD